MLSNTAVPKYYGRFRDAVLCGDIPVCETISMEMNRIDRLIENPDIYYDPDPVEGYIAFCEEELTLTDGSDMHLLDTFKLWAEQIFGWWYFRRMTVYEPDTNNHGGHYVQKLVKKRLINKQYLIVARGAAKSVYAATIQAYGLVVDTTTTEQLVVAPTMDQASGTIDPIKTAISRSRGPLFQMLTEGSLQNTTGSRVNRVKLASTKKGIEALLTNSIIKVRPMSIEKIQGGRPKYSTVDEWLSCDIREDPIGAIEQGAAKIPDWLIVATSSEGTIRNSVGDSVKMELMRILKGDYPAIHTSIWYYRLDNIKEVAHPELWVKANPNLNKTVSYETYQEEVTRAENAPEARNDILAKRFGIPLEGYTYFFAYDETKPHRQQSFWSMPCSLGIDLSKGDDFCAFTFLFPLQDGAFGIKARSYISSRTMNNLSTALYIKYKDFIQEGSLVVLEGSILDMMEVYDDLNNHIEETKYDVRCVGYDLYNAKSFIDRWCLENGDYAVERVIQGAKTESVPLGELKTLAEDRLLIFDEDLMSFTMGNAITICDTNGNRKLLKQRYDKKIDNVSAMMDAYVSYKLHTGDFE